MFRRVGLLGVLLTWLVLAGSSQAALVFEFAVGGTPQTSIDIGGVGQTVDIQVYLSQTGGTTILTDEGLFTAGIQVSFNNPGGIAAVQVAGDIQQNPDFDDPFILSQAVTATTADLNQATDPSSPFVYPVNDRIWLGTFTFTGLALGTTTIGVTDLDSGFEDILTGVGNSLDGLITPGSATLTVTPEPGTVGLSLLVFGAASVVSAYRARRRRSKLVNEVGASSASSSL
jgi:hypothetical protein